MSFGPDGRAVAAAEGDDHESGSVRLWPVAGSDRTSASATLPSEVELPPAFSPDSRLLAAGGAPTTLWRVDDTWAPRPAETLESFHNPGDAVAFGVAGHTVFSGLSVRAWDTSDSAHPRDLLPATVRTSGAGSVSVNPVRPLLAVGILLRKTVQLWDIGDRKRPALLGTLAGAAPERQSLAFSSDGALFAAPSGEGGVRLWRGARHSRPVAVGDVTASQWKTTSLAFAPNYRAGAGRDESDDPVGRHAPPDRPVRQDASTRHTGAVTGLAVHPGGKVAATAGMDGHILLWDLANLSQSVEVASLTSGGLFSSAVVGFSPDGRVLAVASDAGTWLWTMDRTAILRALCADTMYHPGSVAAIPPTPRRRTAPWQPACSALSRSPRYSSSR